MANISLLEQAYLAGQDDCGEFGTVKGFEHWTKEIGLREDKSINLDELQQEAEKLILLLKDRQPGLVSWNEFLHERLKTINKMLAVI